MTFSELLLASDPTEVTQARRASWDPGMAVNVERGEAHNLRISFTFAGPYALFEEDETATDWEPHQAETLANPVTDPRRDHLFTDSVQDSVPDKVA